jgi:hypothetical protein
MIGMKPLNESAQEPTAKPNSVKGTPLVCDCGACDLSFCDCSDMEGSTVSPVPTDPDQQ